MFRGTKEYLDGVDEFIETAFGIPGVNSIKCPCRHCTCIERRDKQTIREHLYFNGVIKDKDFWKYHGEKGSSEVNKGTATTGLHQMCRDAFGMPQSHASSNEDVDDVEENAKRFYKLIEDVEQPLYPGCEKHTKLSFIVRMFNIKCMGGWSNMSFNLMLTLIKEILPGGEVLPNSLYEMKKIIADLGYGYKKIDACPNDCMLYWKENEHLDKCLNCGECRWKNEDDGVHNKMGKKCKVPKKVLRHFPIIPRLQRLYMCSKTAVDMRWHADQRCEDGVLRHPADSPCWKALDAIDNFGNEVRNVRLGLASDGFNPFGTMSINYSTWPVLLIPYNLPPWQCMKNPNIILSLLISGPKAPGNDIDVYLQPLIDELQKLWYGIETFDASSRCKFRMRAALLWTINDFPAYACLSGWSTKGRLACPICNENTCSTWLPASGKHFYHGHRRWLREDHKFRSMRRLFDGKQEWRKCPLRLSGDELLKQLQMLSFTFGKALGEATKSKLRPFKRKRRKSMQGSSSLQQKDKYLNWKKRSIFFDLPYWKFLLLRHNLDVMHIEKNVCDSIIGTLLGIDGKSKDGLKARQDLELMGIRPSLHPQPAGPTKTMLPPASFTLSKQEKEAICNVIKGVKVPDGYASNISRHVDVKNGKLGGLKSHDCHVLLQQILPVAVRGMTQKEVSAVIIDVSQLFVQICSKTSTEADFEALGEHIAVILSRLEMIFLPSFFDVMVHLLVHLPEEGRLGGPVHYRWMYPIERYFQ